MSRPIRLAYLTSSLKLAGGERQMVELAARMPRDRIEVDFLCRTGRGPLDEVARATGANVIHLGRQTSPTDNAMKRLQGRLDRNSQFIRAVRRGRYDIVDAWLYPSDVIAALSRPITRAPVVMAGRINVQEHERFGALGAFVDRLAVRWTDAIVAISPAVAEFAHRAHGVPREKLRVIRNGVEIPERPGTEEIEGLRRSLGTVPGELLLGCVGNYRELKRQLLLLDAFSHVVSHHPSLKLALIGEGPMRPDIERRIETLGLGDRVRVHGAVPDARPLYWAFDLVVQASRSEGVPNVLLEAAAAESAIVATAAGGSGEVITDGETGLLVPIEDQHALSDAILRAVRDAELRSRLGANARRHAAAVFGMDRFVSEWLETYEELATFRRT